MRRWLAWLADAEVRRLRAELDKARVTRARALRAATRWHEIALKERAGRFPLNTNTKEHHPR